MASIPAEFTDLFEKPTFAHVPTLMNDGTPQVTPVWVDYDAEREHLLTNTAGGRLKVRNLHRDPKVGVSMIDPDDPYRFLSVRGQIDALGEDGAVECIDELARRHMNVEEYPNKGTGQGGRVIVEIRPDHVATS